MPHASSIAHIGRPKETTLRIPFTRNFVTVVFSTLVLIVLCALFAPSSLTIGALSGSLPFAAIIAMVGLGQLLVVQQGASISRLPGPFHWLSSSPRTIRNKMMVFSTRPCFFPRGYALLQASSTGRS